MPVLVANVTFRNRRLKVAIFTFAIGALWLPVVCCGAGAFVGCRFLYSCGACIGRQCMFTWCLPWWPELRLELVSLLIARDRTLPVLVLVAEFRKFPFRPTCAAGPRLVPDYS